MSDRDARSLLLLPHPLSDDLRRIAQEWVSAWVADPFLMVVLGDGSVSPDDRLPDVTAHVLGRDGSVSVDLLEELAERPCDLLRVVAINLDAGLVGADPTPLRDEARRVERMLDRATSSHNRLVSMNLVITESDAAGLDPDALLLTKWDRNVLANPENRTGLDAFDAFVRRSRPGDLHGFVLAHALTLGGLWPGMADGPFDAPERRGGAGAIHMQRVSVRGVLAQDFMVQVATEGLDLLAQDETPLRDPTLRAQIGGRHPRLVPIPDDRVDEAVGLLTAYMLDGASGTPLRYDALELPGHTVDRQGAWASVRGFGRFSLDKGRMLPRWVVHRVRTSLQRRTGRALHGEDGTELVVTDRDPFGDAAEFQRDIEAAVELRDRAARALAQPPAATVDGPDRYALFWANFRQGAFRMLDGGPAHESADFEAVLAERNLEGVLPTGSLICPDAREPWSPNLKVAQLVEAETRELPLTLGWLDVDDATRWKDALEELGATYDQRFEALRSAQAHLEDELSEISVTIRRCDASLQSVEELLELDEFDRGAVLDARIEAALAGVSAAVRDVLLTVAPPEPPAPVPPAPEPVEPEPAAPEQAFADGEDESESPDEPPPAPEVLEGDAEVVLPAFDREAARAWRITLDEERRVAGERREDLERQREQLQEDRELLEQVRPLVTEDLLTLGSWRWRLERSFAGRLSHELNGERRLVEAETQALRDEVEREHPALEPTGNLYARFLRRTGIGLAIAGLLLAFLWRPLLNALDVRYEEGDLIVREVLGVPVVPFGVVAVLIILALLLDYHRRWSRSRRQLDALRHRLGQLPDLIEHVERERLRMFELHRQAREMLRLMSEVIHRPFLLDGLEQTLPSSTSLDPETLPKVVRLARPEVDASWDGEAQFTRRILDAQLRPGWRSASYERLLAALQAEHGIVNGELDPARADREPVVRTAALEHLLMDEAQRVAGLARLREVLADILSWSVRSDFPYPMVRIIRRERDPVDVRTDLFDDGVDHGEDWQGFISADLAIDEPWAPAVFDAEERRKSLLQRSSVVYAPPRFGETASDARIVHPTDSDVKPVEMVVRLDVLPDALPVDRFSALRPRRAEADATSVGEPSHHEGTNGVAEAVAAESSWDGADDGGDYNF